MGLVKTCVWGFRVSVFEAKEKASISRPIMGMKSYVRVSVDYGTYKASGNNKEYPSQKNDVSHPVEHCEWSKNPPMTTLVVGVVV
jgi:hypothetical protein